MDNLSQVVISAILALLMLKYVFPKMIYWMCEAVLKISDVMDWCKEKMNDRRNWNICKWVFGGVYLVCWGLMLSLFLPMLALRIIERFAGIVDDEIF